MKIIQALASAILLTITATFLTVMELATAYFPSLSLSRSDYTPQPQEIKPDFYS